MNNYVRRILLGTILPVLLLAGWELTAVRMHNPALLPRVGDVVSILANPQGDLLGTGSLAWNTVVSLFRVLCGFSFAVILCVPLGLCMGRVKVMSEIVGPFVEMVRPMCPIAWIPFAMAMFRTTTLPQLFGVRHSGTIFDSVQIGMLFVILYGGFFPVLLNTIHGVVGVKKIWIDSARSLGASRLVVLTRIIFPAALPAILTGIRIGFAISWMVIIAAEMLPGSDSGIGYLIMYAYELGEMNVLIACMFVIGIIGITVNHGLHGISRNVSGWKALER